MLSPVSVAALLLQCWLHVLRGELRTECFSLIVSCSCKCSALSSSNCGYQLHAWYLASTNALVESSPVRSAFDSVHQLHVGSSQARRVHLRVSAVTRLEAGPHVAAGLPTAPELVTDDGNGKYVRNVENAQGHSFRW